MDLDWVVGGANFAPTWTVLTWASVSNLNMIFQMWNSDLLHSWVWYGSSKRLFFLMFHSNIFKYRTYWRHFSFYFCSVSDVWSSSGYPSFKNVEILLSGNILIICHCLLLTGYYHRNLELFLELFRLFWHIDINNLRKWGIEMTLLRYSYYFKHVMNQVKSA